MCVCVCVCVWDPVVQVVSAALWKRKVVGSESIPNDQSATFDTIGLRKKQSLPVWPPTLNNNTFLYLYLYTYLKY